MRTPPAPPGLSYLLALFAELASARQAGFGAPQPLTWAEIEAWSRLTGMALLSWEARVMRQLDAAWLRAWHDGQPAPKGR